MDEKSQDNSSFSVKFWGVRGTMPVTSQAFSEFGGNTSCVEITCGEKRIILDAGTGIVGLGETITAGAEPIDILLSHTHIDHILGLLYFAPLYDKNAHIRVLAGHLLPELTLKDTLHKLISPPIFPINIKEVASKLEMIDFKAGDLLTDTIDLGSGVTVRTTELFHPDRATGYRIEYDNKSVCYITDIEHNPDTIDEQLKAFIKDADYLIYDSTYDDEEFQKFKGWGHSTWQHAIKLAEAANVKRLALYHHHQSINDDSLKNRENNLNKSKVKVDVSRENMIVNI